MLPAPSLPPASLSLTRGNRDPGLGLVSGSLRAHDCADVPGPWVCPLFLYGSDSSHRDRLETLPPRKLRDAYMQLKRLVCPAHDTLKTRSLWS